MWYTVIGVVKLGEHLYQELTIKGREDTWIYIKPTLERPSPIISKVNDAGIETGCHNFIKAFNEDSNTKWYYSVVMTKDNECLFSISNRRMHKKQIANKFEKHLRAYSASEISEERRTIMQHPQHTSALIDNIGEDSGLVRSLTNAESLPEELRVQSQQDIEETGTGRESPDSEKEAKCITFHALSLDDFFQM